MKGKLWFLLGIIVVGILMFFVFGDEKDRFGGSEASVSLAEVKEELSFGVYEKKDWDNFFAVYHREKLTGVIVLQLLEELGVKDYIDLEQIRVQGTISRAAWNYVYEQILDLLDMEQSVQKISVLILEVQEAEEGKLLLTNEGTYTAASWAEDFLCWNGYELYVSNGRCLGAAAVSEEEFTLSNAYMTGYVNHTITFLYGGVSYEKKIGTLGAEAREGVCDLVLCSGKISALRMKQDIIQGELLSYDEETIEIAGYGKVAHAKNMPVYQVYGEVAEKSLSDIVLGNMEVSYVTGEGQVCAVLIAQPSEIANIRVLLLADDGTNYRQEVYLKCDTNAVLVCGETTVSLPPETVVAAAEYLPEASVHTLVVTPEFTEGQILVCDVSGKPLTNGYSGAMEVRRYAQGYTLVNDVPFETYLTAVVPSEMPSSYAAEALKAQAVCARSYAYRQLLGGDLAELGAHINDSTSYQVYNKTAATEEARAAVHDTAGQMLLYEGEPIEAFYFSTSMGYTCTEEVWNVDETYGYLKSVYLNTEGEQLDLSEEAVFLDYIRRPAQGYDSDVKYYRWSAEGDYRDKTAEINQILMSRRAASPKNIEFVQAGETLETVNADTAAGFGRVTGLSVKERSSAGSILTLCVQYEKGSVLVKNEYNIRKVLGCGITRMVYADASESTNVTMLPSAFCAVTAQSDGTVLLQGGGYGHGLGMSQNGANGMAKAGMNYKEILQYFYQNIEIGTVY